MGKGEKGIGNRERGIATQGLGMHVPYSLILNPTFLFPPHRLTSLSRRLLSSPKLLGCLNPQGPAVAGASAASWFPSNKQ